MKEKLFKLFSICCFLVLGMTSINAQPPCDCEFEFDPVCVETAEGDIIPFLNACIAECEGYGADALVDCPDEGGEWPEDDCDCEEDGELVCVLTAQDLVCVFPNMCYAECAGYTADDVVECEEDGGDWPGEDCDCEFDFDPVCVETADGIIIPFLNACIAECEGYGADALVDCPDEGGEWPDEDCDCEEDGELVCVLTADDLVCVFPNMCYAECAGYTADDVVECEEDGGEWPGEDCDCEFDFDPVCVETADGDIIPFINACIAECEGYGADALVDCPDEGGEWPEDDCDCEEDGEPVCVLTAEGIICPFPNMCLAECAGYTADDVVDCGEVEPPTDCNCTWEFDPVCVTTDAGELYSFPNACFAECAGFGEDEYESCEIEEGCACDAVYDPVCVTTDEGEVYFFSNACMAECEGYLEGEYESCEEPNIPDCNCDFEGPEVCIVIEEIILLFPNVCWLECAGFSADDIGDCEGFNDGPYDTEPILFDIVTNENGFTGDDLPGLIQEFVASRPGTTQTARVYPNPINGDDLTIELKVEDAASAQVNILSLSGAVLQVVQKDLVKGTQQIEINTSELAKGIYFVKVDTGKDAHTMKFVKL